MWASVPSLVQINWPKKTKSVLPDLQLSLFTGEILTPELVNKWSELAPQTKIENLYGPVETTVWVTRHAVDLSEKYDSIPIGQAFGDTHLALQNDELIILGPQVSPGYLTETGQSLFNGQYATKDHAHFHDEQWWFCGRLNQEIKWAGQKVDLAQVEKIFLNLTSETCVAIYNEKFGVGIITSQSFDFKKVFHSLREKLPAASLPRNYFYVENFPLNSV